MGQYQINQPEISTIVYDLFERYQQEKIAMSYTIQDYQKDYVRDHLNLLSLSTSCQVTPPNWPIAVLLRVQIRADDWIQALALRCERVQQCASH